MSYTFYVLLVPDLLTNESNIFKIHLSVDVAMMVLSRLEKSWALGYISKSQQDVEQQVRSQAEALEQELRSAMAGTPATMSPLPPVVETHQLPEAAKQVCSANVTTPPVP
eukprot:5897587-Amphidinium_carterae.1